MRFLILLPLLLLAGCQDRYRYPCQDPANWDNPECNNEACRADGTCTSDTLGPNFRRDPKPVDSSVLIPGDSLEPTAEVDAGAEPVSKPVEKNINHSAVVMDPEGDEHEMPAHTPPSMDEEVPVTMNTIVDTAAHNAATK